MDLLCKRIGFHAVLLNYFDLELSVHSDSAKSGLPYIYFVIISCLCIIYNSAQLVIHEKLKSAAL